LQDVSDRILKRIGNSENLSRSLFSAVPIDFAPIEVFAKGTETKRTDTGSHT